MQEDLLLFDTENSDWQLLPLTKEQIWKAFKLHFLALFPRSD